MQQQNKGSLRYATLPRKTLRGSVAPVGMTVCGEHSLDIYLRLEYLFVLGTSIWAWDIYLCFRLPYSYQYPRGSLPETWRVLNSSR